MLAFSVTDDRLERIADPSKIVERFRSMKNYEFSKGYPLNCSELPAMLFLEDFLGFSTAEGNDQNNIV
jgi:hypothetical protein